MTRSFASGTARPGCRTCPPRWSPARLGVRHRLAPVVNPGYETRTRARHCRRGDSRQMEQRTRAGLFARVLGPPPCAGAPAVVLVHGLGLPGRYFGPLARRLAANGATVLVPDLPATRDHGPRCAGWPTWCRPLMPSPAGTGGLCRDRACWWPTRSAARLLLPSSLATQIWSTGSYC